MLRKAQHLGDLNAFDRLGEGLAGAIPRRSVPTRAPCKTVLARGIEEVRGWMTALPTRFGSRPNWIRS